MEISLYLAMTAAEISGCDALPNKLAYMACHFSSYGAGLSNIPDCLPPESILILNDRTPISGHDHKLIAYQLSQAMEVLQCSSLLLDFQRPDNPETESLCQYLIEKLNCPVGISAPYAAELDCAVFLPPCPPDAALSKYLSPWKGHSIWLEAALDMVRITVTESGSTLSFPFIREAVEFPHREESLFCHYRTDISEDKVTFTLSRTLDDLSSLLQQAEALEVEKAIGLWQELHT